MIAVIVKDGCSSADCSGGDRSPVYGPDLVEGESTYVNVIRREDFRDRVWCMLIWLSLFVSAPSGLVSLSVLTFKCMQIR